MTATGCMSRFVGSCGQFGFASGTPDEFTSGAMGQEAGKSIVSVIVRK